MFIGADYGVCCTAADQLIKPGTCPPDADGDICGVPCKDDTQCLGADKCCQSEACGKHCIPPRNISRKSNSNRFLFNYLNELM